MYGSHDVEISGPAKAEEAKDVCGTTERLKAPPLTPVSLSFSLVK